MTVTRNRESRRAKSSGGGTQHPYFRLQSELNADRLRSVYLLYGDESFLIQSAIQRIEKLCLNPAASQLDQEIYDARSETGKPDWQQILQNAQTPPFLSRKRVIRLRRTGVFSSASALAAKQEEALCELCKGALGTAVLIFWEDEVDRRKKRYKTLGSDVFAAEFEHLDAPELRTWLRGYAKRSGLRLEAAAAAALIDLTESDLNTLSQEMRKLSLYVASDETKGGEIRLEDVRLLCHNDLKDNIFSLFDRLAEGRTEAALEIYRNLRRNKEVTQLILHLFARQIRQLLAAKAAGSRERIREEMGMHPYRAGILLRQSEAFGLDGLIRQYEACRFADEAIKRGDVQEDLAMEQLILNFVSKA